MRVKVKFGKYSKQSYTRPWVAKITLDKNNRPTYDFSSALWLGSPENGGFLYIDCDAGDIIAYGQKAFRKPERTENIWCLVKNTNQLEELTPEQAVCYLHNRASLSCNTERMSI